MMPVTCCAVKESVLICNPFAAAPIHLAPHPVLRRPSRASLPTPYLPQPVILSTPWRKKQRKGDRIYRISLVVRPPSLDELFLEHYETGN